MSAFNSFLKELVAGDNVRDYQHASRIFRDNGYANAPKQSFLFFVVFEINPQIAQHYEMMPEYGVLVKQAELPTIESDVRTLNQYGKPSLSQTGISFSPVQITFHDDNANTISTLWQNYYGHYYANSIGKPSTASTGVYDNPTYRYSESGDIDAYGFSLKENIQFFTNIKIYSLHQQQFTEYTLVSPVISQFKHGQHDYADGSGIMEHAMSVNYENIIYQAGRISLNGAPRGFTVHYDKTQSALANNTTSVFGAGGLADSASGILNNLGSGNILGAALGAAQTFDTWKGASLKGVLKEEAAGILKGVVSGNSNDIFSFPKLTGAVRTPDFNPNASAAPRPIDVSSNGIPIRTSLGEQAISTGFNPYGVATSSAPLGAR